ncbi:MAG: hypothetical protein ACTHLE_04310 [Agriterribacter sp.]
MSNENIMLSLCATYLFEFRSFSDWVNNANKRFKPYSLRYSTLCIDKNGKVCHDGKDMMHARDNNLFPVKVYSLKRSSDNK